MGEMGRAPDGNSSPSVARMGRHRITCTHGMCMDMCMHMYMHMRMSVYMHMDMCMHRDVHTCMDMHMDMYMAMDLYMLMCVCPGEDQDSNTDMFPELSRNQSPPQRV